MAFYATALIPDEEVRSVDGFPHYFVLVAREKAVHRFDDFFAAVGRCTVNFHNLLPKFAEVA